jgi:hypothetical protein
MRAMNNDEAKFILSAYRSGGQDAGDPEFREALKQAETDPNLRDWLNREAVFDAAMIDGLRQVRPPGDLKPQILAGARLTRPDKWRWPLRLAFAAIIVLAAAIVFTQLDSGTPERGTVSDWQEVALDFLSNNPKLDLLSSEPAKLTAYLRAHGSPTLADLPKTLGSLSTIGCKELERSGRRISIMCFTGVNGKIVHLVVTQREGGLNLNVKEPMIAEHNGWAMATWPDRAHAVMLVTRGTVEDLRQYL